MYDGCMRREIHTCFLLFALAATSHAYAAGDRLYGVHWWDYNRPNVGSGPDGGWTVETVLTNSDPWQQGWWFEPLYQQVNQTHNAEIITRVDYTWNAGHTTVPTPTMMSATDWGNKILSDIIGPLGPYAHRWIIGNEPNLLGEGDGWPSNQVTPTGYAQIYNTVRQLIKAQRPQDEVLFAPVSPGGFISGVRWKDGNQWLAEAIDATLAQSDGAIDGFAIHSYGGATASESVANFHSDYVSQLNLIDSRSLRQVPVYITEWNRWTSTTGDQAADEQISADFLRQSLTDVDVWNRTPGDHNIVSLAWFIYDNVPGWENYSIEWWRTHGNPEGQPGDLWTAMSDSSNLLAGMRGTRPTADYNADGFVNSSDYTAWRIAFGRSAYPYADGNHNNVVDAGDYVIWRKTRSAGAGTVIGNVPESTTLWYLITVAALFLVRRRVLC
jgi:hypothetical protein